MTKKEFLGVLANILPSGLAISDGQTITDYPEGCSADDVYDAAQEIPGARILVKVVDETSFADLVNYVPIRCDNDRTRSKVNAFIRYTFSCGTYALADGTLVVAINTIAKDCKELTVYLRSVFGSVEIYDAKRDAYIDITDGPAREGQRAPKPISTQEMLQLSKAFKKSIAEPVKAAGWNDWDVGNFRVDVWAESKGIQIAGKDVGDKIIRVHTPYGIIVQSRKTNGCSLIPMTATAKIRTWEELTRQYDPEMRDIARKEMAAKESNAERSEPRLPATTKPKKKWKSLKDIMRDNRTRHERYLQTDVRDLDQGWNGLKCGSLTILSGYTGNGKSTLLTQMALSMVSHGYHVAVYSGELQEQDYMAWFESQAAGPDRMIRTSYGYDVSEDTAFRIAAYTDNHRLDIYDHVNFGTNVDALIEASKEAIEDGKIDCFIYDNMMMMDIEETENENRCQKMMVQKLHDFAQQYQVAVVLVAHPRKPSGHYFLTPYDILGASAIANLADIIIYVYRCGTDFDRGYATELRGDRSNSADPLHGADGCYAVFKGRWPNRAVNPQEGRLRPLYYDPVSARLLSYPGQVLRFDLDAISEEEIMAIREYVGPADVSMAEDSYQPSMEEADAMKAREAAYGRGNNTAALTEAERKAEQDRLDRAHKLAESQAKQKEMSLEERLGI